MKHNSVIILLALLAGCASKPPSAISQMEVEPLSLATVRLNVDRHIGATVRWGGVISRIDNRAENTWVELVGRPLHDRDRPITDGVSEGRFIASFQGFADPMVYKVGRPLTVVGKISGQTTRAIGDYDYNFPIVSVIDSHLWNQTTRVITPYYAPYPYYPPIWWHSDIHFHHYYPRPSRYQRW